MAANSVVIAALCKRLLAWRSVFRSLHTAPYRTCEWLPEPEGTATIGDIVWFCCGSVHDLEKLARCAEAFVLLRALMRLDGKAGESLLTKLISMQMSSNYRVIDEYGEITRDEGEERRKIKCIGVEFRVRESNRLDSLMAYAKEVHHPSEEYEAICALMRTEGVPMDATQHIPVRIVIDYAYRRTMHFQVGMATAEPIVCAQYDALHSPTATAERTRLLISDVRTENSQYCAHDEASGITIGMVKNIVSRGVRIDHVPLLKWHSYRGDGERDEIETLQLLFGIGKKTSQSAIRSLEFNAGLDRDDAAGIFSALQLTKTVERVRILMPPDKHHSSEWEWLAYSIFSRHAAHNLKEVDLDFQSFTFLPMDVIEAFQKALKMKSLEPPLFGIVARKNGRYVPGKVCAKKFQLYCPPEARPDDQWIMFDPRYTHDPVLFESAEPLNVRALYGLGTDEELIQVLLPGWGLAWVRQRDMLSTEADEDEIAALPAVRSIPHLILSGVQTESIRYAMEVLKILGTSVTSIELRCCKRAIQEREAEEDELGPFQVGPIDSYLRQIFGFCPNLARVVLPEAPVRSLKPFIDRAPKLRALEIEKQLGARTAQFLPLLAALNDSTSSLAQHMQTIRLSLSVRQSADLTAIVSFLSTLLKTNRKLRQLQLTLRVTCPYDLEEIKGKLGQDLSGARPMPGPSFPLESKIALLSVVEHEKFQGSAVSRLDSAVLGLVFGFAARFQLRDVSIHFI